MVRIRHLLLVALLTGLPVALSAEDRLPAALLRIPESVSSVFVAQTSTAEFYRFDRNGKTMVHRETYYMSIGKAGPGKQRAGDQRTPLGAYFITEQLDTSRLHEKYGVTAFPMDYPNAWDKRAERSGDGIWLHGVDPDGGSRPAFDTDGCIALRNEDLLVLISRIEENVTPIIVTQNIQWQTDAEKEQLLEELEASIAAWVDSQTMGDMYTYLSLYDETYRRWGLDKAKWSSLTVQTASSQSEATFTISNLLLLRYPEENNLLLSRFQLHRTVGDQSIKTTKRLYWRRNESGALHIVAEDEG